jgi:hypothetical protein
MNPWTSEDAEPEEVEKTGAVTEKVALIINAILITLCVFAYLGALAWLYRP